MSSGGGDPIAQRTSSFASLVKAEADYNLETAQAQLALAQRDVEEAKADRENIGNEEYQLRVDRLAHQQQLLEAARSTANKRLKTVEEYTHRVSQLEAEGRTNQWIFNAVSQLLTMLDQPTLVAGVMGGTVPNEASAEDNFTPNNEAPDDATSSVFPGGNVGTLLNWMKKHKLRFVPFQPAHLAVISAFGKLSEAAEKKAADFEAKATALRDQQIPSIPQPGGNAQAPGTDTPGTDTPGTGTPKK